MRTHARAGSRIRAAAVLAAILVAQGAVLAQTPLAADQVSGAELQRWVEADGLALAGFDLRGNCQFMAMNRGTVRHLALMCPGQQAPWTVKGEGKVVGNSWCVKFSYPNGTADDHCEEFFKLGENRYEIRMNGSAANRVSRLIP